MVSVGHLTRSEQSIPEAGNRLIDHSFGVDDLTLRNQSFSISKRVAAELPVQTQDGRHA